MPGWLVSQEDRAGKQPVPEEPAGDGDTPVAGGPSDPQRPHHAVTPSTTPPMAASRVTTVTSTIGWKGG